MAAERRPWWALLAAGALALPDCRPADACDPGASRPCVRALDGGVRQEGYQSCEASGAWSACVSVGGCRAGGAALPIYSRCTGSDECGPEGCAVCSNYVGVSNPRGRSVCFVYCQADEDCAPTTASFGVTPRCILGQCALLCRAASSRCPRDSECLPWASAEAGRGYASFDGLCE